MIVNRLRTSTDIYPKDIEMISLFPWSMRILKAGNSFMGPSCVQ